ncbi:MAG: hypothetical protein JXR64_07655 [Spirochaetales bacterium]|nr:hypothetical protein [Spirochaetales bacterium]
MIIYLDLDGVCSNFIKSAIIANNLNFNSTVELWKRDYKGQFSAFKVFGISNSEFWKNIELQGEEFWSEMEEYSWFFPLYNRLKDYGEVIFLTSPSQSPLSHSGKIKWIQKRFTKNFKDYIITPRKELLANKNSILIDDYPENILNFENSGGKGILFPQFWNSIIDVENKLEYIENQLKSCTSL